MRLGAFQIARADIGQRHRARGSLQQPRAEAILQRRDQPRHAGRRQPQFARRRRETREGRPPRQRPAWHRDGPWHYFIYCNDAVSIEIIVPIIDRDQLAVQGEQVLAPDRKGTTPCPASRPQAPSKTSPAAAQPLLQAVKKQLGVVPNLFRLVGNSPAALEGYLGLNGALAKGALEAPTANKSRWPSRKSMAAAIASPRIPISARIWRNFPTRKSRSIAMAVRPIRKPTPRFASPSRSSTRAATSRTPTSGTSRMPVTAMRR